MTLWLNGALLAPEAARIDPADRGFLLGDGLFETIRASGGGAAHLPRHLARLRAGAAVLGIPLHWDDTVLTDALGAVLRADGLAEAAVRITLTRGPGPRGVLPVGDPAPTLLIAAAAMPRSQGPARLIVARSTCRNEASPSSRLKSLNYLDGIIARREAQTAGVDDAILLDTHGRIAEATAATLFALLPDGTLATPPVGDGALPGIFRARMIERSLAVERTLWPADLPHTHAVLLGNALGIRLACAVERHRFDVTTTAARHLLALAAGA